MIIYKINPRLFLAYLILMSTFLFPAISTSQTKLDSVRFSKRIYVSYGGAFTGNGDMWGHKLYLGANYMLSDRLGIDLNVAGLLIDHVYYEYDNRDWSRHEISNGLELSANGLLTLGGDRIRFYSAVGPTIRYGYDQYSSDYGIDYNPDTGHYDWHVDYEEHQGFMFGFNLSVNFDFRLFKRYYLGPKGSMSFFPFDAYRFSYIGLNLSWK